MIRIANRQLAVLDRCDAANRRRDASAIAAFWDDYDWRNGSPIEAESELDLIRERLPQAWAKFKEQLASEGLSYL